MRARLIGSGDPHPPAFSESGAESRAGSSRFLRLMNNSRLTSGSAILTAMICAGAVSAQFIAGKATRDALYLSALPITTLPLMVIATAVVSIALVVLSSQTLRRVSPRRATRF